MFTNKYGINTHLQASVAIFRRSLTFDDVLSCFCPSVCLKKDQDLWHNKLNNAAAPWWMALKLAGSSAVMCSPYIQSKSILLTIFSP